MDEKMNNNEQQNISMDYRTESWATKTSQQEGGGGTDQQQAAM
ncbi:hypothetical protein [Thiolapillus sp.]